MPHKPRPTLADYLPLTERESAIYMIGKTDALNEAYVELKSMEYPEYRALLKGRQQPLTPNHNQQS